MSTLVPRILAGISMTSLAAGIFGVTNPTAMPATASWGLVTVALIVGAVAIKLAARRAIEAFDSADLVRAEGTITGIGVDSYGVVQYVKVRMSATSLGEFTGKVRVSAEESEQVRRGSRVLVELYSHQRDSGRIVEILER